MGSSAERSFPRLFVSPLPYPRSVLWALIPKRVLDVFDLLPLRSE